MSLESETLFCETGNHMWMREKRRGRKPTICPEHRNSPLYIAAGLAAGARNGADACGAGVRHSGTSGMQPAVKQEPQPVTAGISVLQGGKQSTSTIDEICNEISFLENKIISLEEDYGSLLRAASSGTRSHKETIKLFDKCDRLQSDILNVVARLHKVRQQYNQIADKDASQNCRE
jgi:hypothetical protein